MCICLCIRMLCGYECACLCVSVCVSVIMFILIKELPGGCSFEQDTNYTVILHCL